MPETLLLAITPLSVPPKHRGGVDVQDNLFNSEHASERKICMNFPKEIIYSAVEGPGLKIWSIEKNLSIRFVSIPYAECYLYFPSLFLLLRPV